MTTTLRRTVKAAFASVLAAAAVFLGTGTANAALPPAELQAFTDNQVFSVSLGQFVTTRGQAPHSDQLDWSSDGCSWSPDQPFGYEFLNSCHRHDFGYRNYKLQGRFTEANRLRIDDKFRSDMYSVCGGGWTCERTADVYYYAVRNFGGSGTTADALSKVETQAQLVSGR
ncbi:MULTISPECIES: phospholipase [Actinoalloteichus]|uniref:Prokaryotic phospholipase A2 n=1 Tax=Actinoalloteichus fjordicus TaxID=1612552 RepID=A0AAC9LAF7_9PSEU|nr:MULTISPECIES: phospholipase [Actinoalloteichus]APU13966.1 Prokaryotic phospholipase A2 [Actinoalloteichus fjordicus]APU19912.1 Prokaryotic phospholipase A2 [Actinoalloteichus sp. GBA129-24]